MIIDDPRMVTYDGVVAVFQKLVDSAGVVDKLDCHSKVSVKDPERRLWRHHVISKAFETIS